MHINFFDDPTEAPRPPADVRIRRLGFYVYPDKRRLAVGFDLTPFARRPSLEINLVNAHGRLAGSMTVIEALQSQFTLTVHLRDSQPTATYEAQVSVYYKGEPGEQRQLVQQVTHTFSITPGEQSVTFEG